MKCLSGDRRAKTGIADELRFRQSIASSRRDSLGVSDIEVDLSGGRVEADRHILQCFSRRHPWYLSAHYQFNLSAPLRTSCALPRSFSQTTYPSPPPRRGSLYVTLLCGFSRVTFSFSLSLTPTPNCTSPLKYSEKLSVPDCARRVGGGTFNQPFDKASTPF